jgi:hypothetical protein
LTSEISEINSQHQFILPNLVVILIRLDL